MSKPQRTAPGTWAYEHDEDKMFTPEQVFAKGKLVAQVIGDSAETEANARFIVLADHHFDALHSALKRIITELPAKRDWLDPDLETFAKAVLVKIKAEQE